jgi:carboxymethylenebutenolidase
MGDERGGRLTRREFVVSGALAAGLAGYTLAAGPVRAEAIRTPAEGLDAGPVEIPAGDRAIPAYRARPQGAAAAPVVLVVQEIFGLHEYIRDVCRRLAHAGYLAVAPDLYVRHGDVTKLASIDAIRPIVAKVPDAEVMRDLDAAAAWAAAEAGGDAGRLAITGFCWGGRIVWLYAAHNPKLRAGVAWYGRLVGEAIDTTPRHPIDVAGALHAPVLGLYGGDDPGIPPDTVEKMRAALAEAGGRSRIEVFPGAPHGFHADYRPSYRREAAEDGWRQMLAWFGEHGAGA